MCNVKQADRRRTGAVALEVLEAAGGPTTMPGHDLQVGRAVGPGEEDGAGLLIDFLGWLKKVVRLCCVCGDRAVHTPVPLSVEGR